MPLSANKHRTQPTVCYAAAHRQPCLCVRGAQAGNKLLQHKDEVATGSGGRRAQATGDMQCRRLAMACLQRYTYPFTCRACALPSHPPRLCLACSHAAPTPCPLACYACSLPSQLLRQHTCPFTRSACSLPSQLLRLHRALSPAAPTPRPLTCCACTPPSHLLCLRSALSPTAMHASTHAKHLPLEARSPSADHSRG